MKKIFVHVGTPKSGSSAIQAFLGINKSNLNAIDFDYPNFNGFSQFGLTDAGNASFLEEHINSGNKNPLDHLLSSSSCNNIIISSENLFSKLKDDPKKFFDYFSAYDCTFICYVRRFDEYFNSCVNQAIKNHDYQSFDEFSYDFLKQLEWAGTILKAYEFITINKLIVRKYIKGSGIKNGVVLDFLDVIGIRDLLSDFEPDLYKIKINPSLSPAALTIRQILNVFDFDRGRNNLKYKVNSFLASYSIINRDDNGQILSKQILEEAINYHLPLEKSLSKFLGNDDFFDYESLSLIEANKPTQIQLQEVVSYLCDSCPDLVRDILLSASRRLDIERVRQFVNMIYTSAFCNQEFFNHGLLNKGLYETLCNLAPPVMLISFNNAYDCIHSITNCSLSISKDKSTFLIVADNNDPYFSLNPVLVKKYATSSYLFEAILKSTEDTDFKIYYLIKDCFEYTENFTHTVNINRGVNYVLIHIFDKRFSGFVRVDPGIGVGLYEFTSISLKILQF